MIKVVLFGASGRMGRLVASNLAEIDDIQLVAGVECPGHYSVGSTLGDAPVIEDGSKIPDADAWIDFSIAGSAMDHIRMASKINMPIVVAATGFAQDDLAAVSYTHLRAHET